MSEEKTELEILAGEYYFVQDTIGGKSFWMIIKVIDSIKIDENFIECRCFILSSQGVYSTGNACVKTNTRKYRQADKDQINWLNTCIDAGMYVSHGEYLQQMQRTAEKELLPKIEIIQEWMLVWNEDSKNKTKRFVLAKFENKKFKPYLAVESEFETFYFIGKEYSVVNWTYAEPMPNYDGTVREIDGRNYLLTLKK